MRRQAVSAVLLGLVAVGVVPVIAVAQQITGVPGSPSAMTTINGQQLPAPPSKFGGVIKDTAQQSKPYWPPRIVPPKDAPNVLLIMTDDSGYGVPSTFGGVIPTPVLDRVAASGLRYTNFHSTALCSPTRAALITGRNHHSVGFGVISEQATGFPGYDSFIPRDKATIGIRPGSTRARSSTCCATVSGTAPLLRCKGSSTWNRSLNSRANDATDPGAPGPPWSTATEGAERSPYSRTAMGATPSLTPPPRGGAPPSPAPARSLGHFSHTSASGPNARTNGERPPPRGLSEGESFFRSWEFQTLGGWLGSMPTS